MTPPSTDLPAPRRIDAKRRLAQVLALVWLLSALAGAWSLHREGLGAKLDGARDGLLAPEHRMDRQRWWLLVRLSTTAGRNAEPATTSSLLAAALSIAQTLPDERVPLAPPRNASVGWIDAHGLYLLPTSRHSELAQRFDDEPMAARVQGLRAIVSSPLFGVSGIEPRRDPLAIRELLHDGPARLSATDPTDRRTDEARPTGSGDLIAPDGRRLVIELRSSRAVSAVLADVQTAVDGLPVTVQLIGPAATDQAGHTSLRNRVPMLGLTALLLTAVVLTLLHRRVTAALLSLVFLAGTAVLVVGLGPTLDVFTLPLLGWLITLATAGAAMYRAGVPGVGVSALVIATALLPLAAGPYPQWRTMGYAWTAAAMGLFAVAAIVLGRVGFGERAEARIPRRTTLRPLVPGAFAVAVVIMLIAGVWSYTNMVYRPVDRMPSPVAELERDQLDLVGEFFDPQATVQVASRGPTLEQALTRAANDVRVLGELVPDPATRVDSPATLIATESELAERRTALAALEIGGRMSVLQDTLQSQGFRPDAFAEAMAAAADLARMPDSERALDSALRPWIDRYVTRDDEGYVVGNRVQLRPGASVGSQVALTPRGDMLEATGPRVAGGEDEQRHGETLALMLGMSLWIGALITWIASRQFLAALVIAAAAAASQATTLVLLHVGFDFVLSPVSLPGLLLASAITFAAGIPCAQAMVRRLLLPLPLMVWGLSAPTAASLALIMSAEPIWQAMGVVMVVGTTMGTGFGLFVAPSLVKLVRTTRWGSATTEAA